MPAVSNRTRVDSRRSREKEQVHLEKEQEKQQKAQEKEQERIRKEQEKQQKAQEKEEQRRAKLKAAKEKKYYGLAKKRAKLMQEWSAIVLERTIDDSVIFADLPGTSFNSRELKILLQVTLHKTEPKLPTTINPMRELYELRKDR